MNLKRRSTVLIILAIVLAAFSIPCFYYVETRFSYTLLDIYLQDHLIPEDISFSSGNATDIRLNPSSDPIFYIVCLPSEVSSNERLRLSYSHFRTLEINGRRFHAGDEIYAFAKGLEHEPVTMRLYAPRGELLYDGYVEFMFADSVSTMYLTTSENAIDAINATGDDTYPKPQVSSTLKTIYPDGSLDVITGADIYRHGNTSFDFFDQKPYNLSLSSSHGLLGMTSGRKWVLKSNGQYSTVVLKNEIAFEAARRMGGLTVPESRYINLYINGKYMGLYQLTQRVQSDDMYYADNMQALMELDVKYESRPHSFIYNGTGITIHHPEELSDAQLDVIRSLTESALCTVDSDGDYEKYIDMDSFIKMYVLQDFFVQTDIDGDSLYFYIGEDNRLHAGPVWDFDCSCGHITSGPYHEELTVRSRYFHDFGKLFFNSLEHSDRFMQRVYDYYSRDFSDIIHEYASNGIPDDISCLAASTEMSNAVNQIPEYDKRTDDDPYALKEWIEARADYLDGYCTSPGRYEPVTFYFAWGSMTAGVRSGTELGFLPDDMHPDNTDDIWGKINGFEDVKGNAVSDATPINSPLALYAIYDEDSPTAMYGYFKRPSEDISESSK